MDKNRFEKIDTYIAGLLAPEDEALIGTRQSIDRAGMPQHSIFSNQGKFLQIMMRLVRANRVLEIGTLAGYSTIWMARALPERGKLITIELDLNYAEVARDNISRAGLDGKVSVKTGEALAVLDALEKEATEPFDLVFMDAHKPSYIQYFDWALRHTKSGGLIIADNVIRDGDVLDENTSDEKAQGVRAYNQMLSENKSVLSTIITNASGNGFDGMAISMVL